MPFMYANMVNLIKHGTSCFAKHFSSIGNMVEIAAESLVSIAAISVYDET